MRVQFHKDFHKRVNALKPAQKEKLMQALRLFQEQPHHPSLRNHALTGEWAGYRSISAGGNLRLHFKILNGNVTYFVAVGTHSQLHK